MNKKTNLPFGNIDDKKELPNSSNTPFAGETISSEQDALPEQTAPQQVEQSPQQVEQSQQAKTKQTLGSVIKKLSKRWFIDAFSGMALGLFATLIAGTIFEQIGKLIGDNLVGNLIVFIAKVAKTSMGAGIGVGIAHSLKTDKLTMFACAVAGFAGAFASGWLGSFTINFTAIGQPGNPIGAYLTALTSAELGKLVAGRTKLDILLVPLVALTTTCIVAVTLCPPVTYLLRLLSQGIAMATVWSPFLMGIVIAVVMGLLLTLPTSSAAIWVTLATLAPSQESLLLAGGAAVVGCCCHMVGFAVMSYKENGFGGLIAQGLGTSMLQIPNLMRNPRILIPPVVASAVCGPLATTVFKLRCATGAGMGTSGLVGVIDTISVSLAQGLNVWLLVGGIILLMFVLPAVISYFTCLLLRKVGWISSGDLKLSL
ncbi:MAG: PTS sugar transporter subunit IIC [Clostridia bacterium]